MIKLKILIQIKSDFLKNPKFKNSQNAKETFDKFKRIRKPFIKKNKLERISLGKHVRQLTSSRRIRV